MVWDKQTIELIKNRLITLSIGVLAIIVVLGGYSFVNYFTNRPQPPRIEPVVVKKEIEAEKQQIHNELDKYSNYKKVAIYPNGLVTPTALIESCEDQKRIPERCNEEIAKITKTLATSGSIGDAFLYIKVGVSRSGAPAGPLTAYDSIWFYVDDSDYGGHLLRSGAIINQQSENGLTELLFNLKKVPFVRLPYQDNVPPEKVRNILDDKLNVAGKHFIGAFFRLLGSAKFPT